MPASPRKDIWPSREPDRAVRAVRIACAAISGASLALIFAILFTDVGAHFVQYLRNSYAVYEARQTPTLP